MHLTTNAIATCLILLIAGCATHRQPAASDHRLESASFQVEFIPTDVDNPTGNQSHYRVIRTSTPRHAHLVASGFRGDHPLVALGYQKKNVRLIESNDGKKLLIEEYIPNDCWMLKNYLLVSVSGSGSLEHTYLKVPERPHEGAPNDPSTLISLDGEILTFRYASGTIERRDLSSIPRMAQPRPVG